MFTALVIFVISAALVGGLITYSLHYPRFLSRADSHRFAHRDVKVLVGSMSLEEKLDQLSGDLSILRFQGRYAINLLAGRGAPHIYAGRNERLGIPPLTFTDGPRGVNVGVGRTCFPVTMCRGASWDPDLERRIGEAMGREIRAIDANYSGAVCVNLLRHPGWGRAQETYGEDPWLLGIMGTALTRGIQAHNVMACAKHFALNSIENSRFYVDVQVDERTLREVYLPHFKRIVQEGQVASVMSAYNRVRGEFCGHNRELLTDILRTDWGFEGFVTSDWIHGVRNGVAAINAGLDVEMPARYRFKGLADAVAAGAVSTETVDASVERVLRTRMRFATAEDPEPYPPDVIACDAHIALAREAAEAGMVLLENDDLLPLKIGNIGVFGHLAAVENTGDHGSSAVLAPHVITPLEGIRTHVVAKGGTVRFNNGISPYEASKTARMCDAAVVVVGLSAQDEGEYFVLSPDERGDAKQIPWFGGGGDRTRLGLRRSDLALIAAVAEVNPNTVVVLVGGSAILVGPWAEEVRAVLCAFYGGMQGGTALARVLFGEVSPSGKLPFTIPKYAKDLPLFEPFAQTAFYGRYHGYTLFEKHDLPVAYPFGHGLSYTAFEFRDLEVSGDGILRVAATVVNTGDRPGSEVAQLYVGFPESAVDRAPFLLRGFEKIHLEPAESKRVTFEVTAADLAWYDADHGVWRQEYVRYDVRVGGSSRGGIEGSCALTPTEGA